MKTVIVVALLLMSVTAAFAEPKELCDQGTYWNAQDASCRPICPEGTHWNNQTNLCLKNIVVTDKGAMCPAGMQLTVSQKEETGSVKIGMDWVRCVEPSKR